MKRGLLASLTGNLGMLAFFKYFGFFVSSADTGFYYVTKKNSRTMTEKMKKKKYDPIARKHVEFTEQKIK